MLGSWQGRHASRRGLIYHVMNRTAGRFRMLRRDADFEALERVLVETHQREPMRILSYCLMGNHWHFVVWPRRDGQLSDFFRWLTHTHTMRWRVAHRSVGDGHLYGGRFKAFAVQTGPRLADVLRYVERNALSAGLVKRAEQWRWTSLWSRDHGRDELRAVLCDWPIARPANWIERVNAAIDPRELARLELCEHREQPYGEESWVRRTVKKLGLEHTVRREGRPRKEADN
jgi:putative transposase